MNTQRLPRLSQMVAIPSPATRSFRNDMKTQFDANDSDAPWLVVPLVLLVVLVAGLALILGWSVA